MTTATRTPLSPTPRSTLNRSKHRGSSDRADLDAVLATGLICHLGVVLHGGPVVLPTAYGWAGDTLYLHGSTGAGGLRAALREEVSVCVTQVDGLVHSRSAMHFSMNYRSAVVRGRPVEVTDPDHRVEAMRLIVEQSAPGSWDRIRPPDRKEMAATLIMALDLTEASVKTRTGGPADDPDDIATSQTWAGVLPLHQYWGTPIDSPDLAAGIEVPADVACRTGTASV